MGEDALRIFFGAQCRQGGDDRQCNGGNGDELEHAGENSSNKVEQLVQGGIVHPAQRAADYQRRHPKDKLLAVALLTAFFNDFSCFVVNLRGGLFVCHDTLLANTF